MSSPPAADPDHDMMDADEPQDPSDSSDSDSDSSSSSASSASSSSSSPELDENGEPVLTCKAWLASVVETNGRERRLFGGEDDFDDDWQVPFARVLSVADGSPMSSAGVLPGDLLGSVDTFDVDASRAAGSTGAFEEDVAGRLAGHLEGLAGGAEVIVQVRRKRGGTSDFQHELVAHYLNLAPTADAGGLQGLEIVAVTEADVENRQSWDHWNPKPEPDVDATYRFAVAAKVGPPIASEHIRGVGWVGTSMAAAWALDKRNGWCTHCKKRGHYESQCWVKDASKAKLPAQQKRGAYRTKKLLEMQSKEAEVRRRGKQARDSAKKNALAMQVRIDVGGQVTLKTNNRPVNSNKQHKVFTGSESGSVAQKVCWGKK